jgi:glycosyltransferase involved in cell wall biosynthesis
MGNGRRALMALMFFPRGGSAQVARYVAAALPEAGWEARILSGSLGERGEASNAETFYAGLDARALDYTGAVESADPLMSNPPFHGSFEDRPGQPDRVFAKVDDAVFQHLVQAWEAALHAAGAGDCDVLHLHHLTPINEAAQRSFPDVPRVGHLHGTELLMLRDIEQGPPEGWAHAEAWAGRLRRWARSCTRLFVLSKDAVERVPALLDVDPERVRWAPNGFDPELFDRRPLSGAERVALWRRWLVQEPRGWDESGRPGSISYRDTDLDAFQDGNPVLLYVGRYTEVKRLPLLIRAHARASGRFELRAPLVILGGYPGEWEGEHPAAVIRESGARDVFLTGWHGHEDLPDAINASDATVLASVHEQFGLVLVEGMACGLPAVAVDAHGPATIVADGETGWLVPPDDEQALADALVHVVNDRAERRRRGAAAYAEARAHYSWPSLAHGVARVYEEAAAAGAMPPTD